MCSLARADKPAMITLCTALARLDLEGRFRPRDCQLFVSGCTQNAVVYTTALFTGAFALSTYDLMISAEYADLKRRT